MQSIKSYGPEALGFLIKDLGEPKFRAKQLLQWLYQKNINSFDEMTNLPKSFIQELNKSYTLDFPQVIDKQISKDKTRKYLLKLYDDSLIETVAIETKNRLTVCFSTQVGCGLGCAFCATGALGFRRNLEMGEIVDQLSIVENDLKKRVTNAVAMGQGEPFLNYASTLSAIDIINSDVGKNVGARHITLSTSGIIKGIYSLAEENKQYTLAVSLHSAIQKTRDFLMPGLAHQTLKNLHDALKYYTRKTGRRISLEYTVFKDVNDNDQEIDALVDFCQHLKAHVNLIPFNQIKNIVNLDRVLMPTFYESQKSRLHQISLLLNQKGINTSVRNSAGNDIDAACGQLTNKHNSIY